MDNITAYAAARRVLVEAIRTKDYDLADMLLRRRLVSPNIKDPKSRRTMLHVAASLCHDSSWERAAQSLLVRGANPNLKDRSGNTSLILVCRNSTAESTTLATKMMEYGANPNITNRDHCSALDYALVRPNASLQRALLASYTIRV